MFLIQSKSDLRGKECFNWSNRHITPSKDWKLYSIQMDHLRQRKIVFQTWSLRESFVIPVCLDLSPFLVFFILMEFFVTGPQKNKKKLPSLWWPLKSPPSFPIYHMTMSFPIISTHIIRGIPLPFYLYNNIKVLSHKYSTIILKLLHTNVFTSFQITSKPCQIGVTQPSHK